MITRLAGGSSVSEPGRFAFETTASVPVEAIAKSASAIPRPASATRERIAARSVSATGKVRTIRKSARSSASPIASMSIATPCPSATVFAPSSPARVTIRLVTSAGLSIPRNLPPTSSSSRANADASSARSAEGDTGTAAMVSAGCELFRAPVSSASFTLAIILCSSATSVWRALRLRALMRARPGEVAKLSPVTERSRHPAQIAVMREWFQNHCGEFSERSNRPRMARCSREPPRPGPRLLDLARPVERMLAGALFPSEMKQDSRDVDLDGTDVFARAAQRRGKRQVSGGAAEKIWTDDRSDRSRINRAVCVASYATVNRTDVEARAASDAIQRLAQHGIREHRAAPVVEDDDVHLARPVELAFAPRPRDETGVGRELLPGRGAREDFQEVAHVFELRYDLLDAHHGDERLRHRARQASVAFVLDDDQRAGFRDRKIDSCNAEVRRQKNRAQSRARFGREFFRLGRVLDAELVGEELADIFLRQVNGGRDDVRRALAAKLHNVFAKIGLDRVDPGVRERVVEIDFLGRHRLALDDVPCALGLRERDDIVARLDSILGEKHLTSIRFEFRSQIDQQFVEMSDRVGLDSMCRLALLVVRREVRFDLREVIEMTRAGALELAPQLVVAARGAARLDDILGFGKFRHPGCRASVVGVLAQL